MRKPIACLSALLMLGSSAWAQEEPKVYTGTGFFSHFKRSYLPRYMPPVEFGNSNRLDSLMRAGRIYLSVQDAIALALENNLDLELARFNPKIADSDELRASAGQLLRGINQNVSLGPSSTSSGVLSGINSLGANAQGGQGGGGQSGVLSGVNVQLAGSSIPNLDPVAFVGVQRYHQTQPQSTSVFVGANSLVTSSTQSSYGIQKGFLTGTTMTLQMNNVGQWQDSPINQFNPITISNAQFTVSQHLLQGFGLAVNRRAIRIAKNNRHSADLLFKQQVMATVSNVVSLYYDLVTLDENLKVKQHALELNTKLYTDNKRRAELGAIAPIDIIQAEAEMAAAQQDVTTAETQVMQQENILKSVLTRSGIDSLSVADARIVPTTTFQIPDTEPVRPVQDLIAEALAERPEVAKSRVDLENQKITMQGTRSAMLPTLDVGATLINRGLAGQINTVPIPEGVSLPPGFLPDPSRANTFFLGGYGRALTQLFARNFPDYGVGFQLNIPLRNRSAQADYIRDQLALRQQQINDRQIQNNVKLNVINAKVALEQARAAYETSVKARKLQEQTLNGERRKYELGTSSFLNVVIVQRDLVTRQSAEVAALNTYEKARLNLQTVTGEILSAFNVDMSEALSGKVKRPPSPLPVLDTHP